MSEIDIQIIGLSKIDSKKTIDSLKEILKLFRFLDLKRLNNIVITDDIQNSAIVFNKNSKISSNTKALVLTIEKNYDYEFILLLENIFIINILKNKEDIEYKKAFHILHHELAHIHDNNKKIDNLKQFMKNNKYKGIDSITYPLSESCWSEYIANFISAESVLDTDYFISSAESLLYIIKELNELKNSIISKDEKFISLSIEKVNTFFKRSSYLIGYINGLNILLEELDEKLSLELNRTFCYEYFNKLKYVLTSMHSIYPNGFINIRIYENIASLIKRLYEEMGIYIIEEDNHLQIILK